MCPPITPFPLTGSSFLGPGGFPEPFAAPGVPSTSTLSDFTAGPPSISYQPNIPGGLLAPEKPPVPPLPAQVSWAVGGGTLPKPPCLTGGGPGGDGLTAVLFPPSPQLPPPGRMESSHPAVQTGLHNTPSGSQPAPTLHSRSAVARQPLGPPAHTADLVFPPAPSMAAAGDGSEPTLDVSTQGAGQGSCCWLGTPAAAGGWAEAAGCRSSHAAAPSSCPS